MALLDEHFVSIIVPDHSAANAEMDAKAKTTAILFT
jgi:hypothetical protein